MQAADTLHVENETRDRRADDGGDRERNQEQAEGSPTIRRRKPQGQEKNNAWKKSSLGNAKQKTNNVEACLAHHEGLGPRYDAPGDHDAGNPDPRAEFVEREIARHFDKEIPNEENPRRASESRRAEPQILAHRGVGKADIDAIKNRDEIADNQEREQAPGDPIHGS